MTQITADPYPQLVRYGPEGQHPVIKVPGSKYVIVDAGGPNWFQREQGFHPDAPLWLDIHFDHDDPAHEFLPAEAWGPLPNAKTLAKWHAAPHQKSMRLRLRRQMSWSADTALMQDRAILAGQLQDLAGMIRADPTEAHLAGIDLEYYPHDHSVWHEGKRWLTISQADLDKVAS